MQNEERILGLLEHLVQDVSGLKQSVSGLERETAGLKQEMAELKADVSGLKQEMAELKADVSTLKTDVAELKADVSGLKEDVSGLKEDVSGLKEETASLKAQMGQMDERLRRVELTQENLVLPQLRLLAEGHDALLTQTVPVRRMEAVESDVDMLKTVVHVHSQDIRALKKAR